MRTLLDFENAILDLFENNRMVMNVMAVVAVFKPNYTYL
jgi:hypothetical protein